MRPNEAIPGNAAPIALSPRNAQGATRLRETRGRRAPFGGMRRPGSGAAAEGAACLTRGGGSAIVAGKRRAQAPHARIVPWEERR